ncbi:MAG: 2-amino-4-hydroxy-6-hydroxymethyldihydropteridine diphosphokinase, partial [Bacteroidales bacterium]|nr:2-amino-4-hydroxy-6-hydroxymethyldihydropteridine diphosphokinase [Bacteroidales bacterium]
PQTPAGPDTGPEASGAASDAAPSEIYASRPIDIDILFFGALVLDTPLLTVPHPRLPLRRFALLPLCDLAPGLVHPLLHRSVADLLAACPDTSAVIPVP